MWVRGFVIKRKLFFEFFGVEVFEEVCGDRGVGFGIFY